MKHCINKACNAELEDYQERCPVCGLTQKTFEYKEPSQRKKSPEKIIPKRHGLITVWLILVIVANVVYGIASFYPKILYGNCFPDSFVGMSVFSGILSFIIVIGASMLLSWEKIGYTFIVVSVILQVLSSIIFYIFLKVYVSVIFPIANGVVANIVLWFVLHIKKDGISYWEILDVISKNSKTKSR